MSNTKYTGCSVFVLSDNPRIFLPIKNIIESIKYKKFITKILYGFSPTNTNPAQMTKLGMKMVDINKDINKLVDFDVILSVHCQQIFPMKLIKHSLCVNLHPGFNPYNRGWAPHTFALLTNTPVGATLHLIDDKIDHGPIIDQERIKVYSWDTAKDIYKKILATEIKIFRRNFLKILTNSYSTIQKTNLSEGSFHTKKQFEFLKKIDLSKQVTMKEALNHLRAFTFDSKYSSSYFVDEQGNRVSVKIQLKRDS